MKRPSNLPILGLILVFGVIVACSMEATSPQSRPSTYTSSGSRLA